MGEGKADVVWQSQMKGGGNRIPSSHLAKFALGQRPSSALERLLKDEL